jgi:hypothetical protein
LCTRRCLGSLLGQTLSCSKQVQQLTSALPHRAVLALDLALQPQPYGFTFGDQTLRVGFGVVGAVLTNTPTLSFAAGPRFGGPDANLGISACETPENTQASHREATLQTVT